MAEGPAACIGGAPPEPRTRPGAHPGHLTVFRKPFDLFRSLARGRFGPQSRHARDDSVILRERTTNNHAVFGDLIRTEFVAVVTSAHLDHRHHAAQLAFHLDIALDDDLVRDEGYFFRRESNVGKSFHDFRGHEYRDT